MITRENWKGYVGYQPVSKPDSQKAIISYLDFASSSTNSMEFRINSTKIPVDQITLTEDELVIEINSQLRAFGTVKLSEGQLRENELIRAKNSCDQKNCQGKPNINISNIWFYKGKQDMDAPHIVTEH